ncbi:glycoside hydrolase family 19 protein [Burkholderia contaminans]|uniref:glycoside hydrolase family 19 protein n=2 Tax=Burkholderiaceae TaxID=119060 RepID=UPI0010F4F9C0|nr:MULTISPECIES: glycoside hydrolase family 19 protein [Burkholderia]MBD1412844.1 glycoside hydrolase family 19 protein [Burkholderia contaminans]UXZ68705.1 glycoside hydrolase family 19 protein [Burkholderia contaminans]UXZ76466.1 glycoside hydrolase family 19 protein [Burkholderia contaminans]
MIVTASLLVAACGASQANAAKFAVPLRTACDRYSINTPQRMAAFLAQIGHESMSLSQTEESFNYSIPALMATFPRAMPFALAQKYGRQASEKAVPLDRQKQIASIVYANRYGNGDSASGDGWRYRGSGLVQTTFKDNFKAAGDDIGVDLVSKPDLLRADPTTAALAAGYFWLYHGLNALSDSGNFDAVTRRINPAMAGKPDRDKRYAVAKGALGI